MCNNRNSLKGGGRRGNQACYRLARLLVLKCSARAAYGRGKNPVLPSAATHSAWLLFGSRAQPRASSGSEVGAAAEKCRLSG